MTDKERATKWLNNDGCSDTCRSTPYVYNCDCDAVGLDKLFAEVRAEARRAALEEAAELFAVTSRTHRHAVYADESERLCRRCDADDATARRIRSLMEPKEQP